MFHQIFNFCHYALLLFKFILYSYVTYCYVLKQEGSIFSAAGDSCAYCWDMVRN